MTKEFAGRSRHCCLHHVSGQKWHEGKEESCQPAHNLGLTDITAFPVLDAGVGTREEAMVFVALMNVGLTTPDRRMYS